MAFQLLLTIDLNSVNEYQRQRFYDYLLSQNLVKTNLTTTWKATWDAFATYNNAILSTKDILAKAATYAGIIHYEALFMISTNESIALQQ